ncbi:MAG: class I SAM-dependent methyltransferase [Herpetosiphon sp.]
MYKQYAPVYERIGQAAWSVRMAAWALDWLQDHGVEIRRVADWGCGTGAAAEVFARSGYEVVGIDGSAAMLKLARARGSLGVRWIKGDLGATIVEPPAQLVTCFFDTLNYLATTEALTQAWKCMAQSLVPGGYAIADVLTPAAYAQEWNEQDRIVADSDDVFVLQRLQHDPLLRVGTGRIIWFVRTERGWVRGEEVHRQRSHSDAELVKAITDAGLHVVERVVPDGNRPDEHSTRVIYVTQKGRSYVAN